MSIDRSSPSVPRCGWAVYYTSPSIVITSWYVETPTGRHPVAELDDVRRYLNPRWMELRATHRGVDVLLLGTRDKVEFERVRRALIRAVEVNRERQG